MNMVSLTDVSIVRIMTDLHDRILKLIRRNNYKIGG